MDIILLLIVFLNFFFGIFIILQKPASMSHWLFFMLSIFAGIWAFTNYMTMRSLSLLWLKTTYTLGSLVIATGLAWIIIITEEKIGHRRALIIFLLSFFFALLPFGPNFIQESYELLHNTLILRGGADVGLLIYTFYYIIFSLLIIYQLIHFHNKSKDGVKKKQIRLIFIGSLITLILSAITSFILPLFSYYIFAGVDNIFFLFFSYSIVYAISRHELFNIKIVTGHLVILILWIIVLFQVLRPTTSPTLQWSLVIVVFILSILFIQNLVQGIKQREEIKNLTESLKNVHGALKKDTFY